jgi:hypothetical protein
MPTPSISSKIKKVGSLDVLPIGAKSGPYYCNVYEIQVVFAGKTPPPPKIYPYPLKNFATQVVSLIFADLCAASSPPPYQHVTHYFKLHFAGLCADVLTPLPSKKFFTLTKYPNF